MIDIRDIELDMWIDRLVSTGNFTAESAVRAYDLYLSHIETGWMKSITVDESGNIQAIASEKTLFVNRRIEEGLTGVYLN